MGFTRTGGIQFKNTSSGICYVYRLVSTGCISDSLIITAAAAPTGASYCVGLAATNQTFRNSLIIGGKTGAYLENYTGSVIQNCTFTGQQTEGINRLGANSAVLTNNVVVVAAGTCYLGNTTTPGSNNASSDTSAFGTSPQINISTTTGVDFVNYGAGNYTPAANGKLDEEGLNLFSTFQNDIAYLTRPSSGAWSIGAYKAAGAQPTGIKKIYLGSTQLQSLKLGSTNIKEVYVGSTKVFG
jgi:hypothetical protein